MKTRAELLAKYEAWEAAQSVKREAAKAEREASVAAPPVDRVGYQDQVRAVWAKPEPTPWDELTPEQQAGIKKLRAAAGDVGPLDGAVSESVLGGLLFPWQARAARRQAKAQREVDG